MRRVRWLVAQCRNVTEGLTGGFRNARNVLPATPASTAPANDSASAANRRRACALIAGARNLAISSSRVSNTYGFGRTNLLRSGRSLEPSASYEGGSANRSKEQLDRLVLFALRAVKGRIQLAAIAGVAHASAAIDPAAVLALLLVPKRVSSGLWLLDDNSPCRCDHVCHLISFRTVDVTRQIPPISERSRPEESREKLGNLG